jgi:hypothetical protein
MTLTPVARWMWQPLAAPARRDDPVLTAPALVRAHLAVIPHSR